MKAFAVSSRAFRGKDGSVPEIGSYIIIRLSVTDELAVLNLDER